MTIDNLYTQVLIEPCALDGVDELVALSGYASPTLAYRHLDEVVAVKPAIRVRLYVGMCSRTGQFSREGVLPIRVRT